MQTWATQTPDEAYAYLSKPDVTVTNQSDKDKQLPKIKALNADTRAAFQSMTALVHSKATNSAAAAVRQREKLAQFEREHKVTVNDDNPMKVAIKQAEREAAEAKRDQEHYDLGLSRGVNPMMMEREELEALEHEKREKARVAAEAWAERREACAYYATCCSCAMVECCKEMRTWAGGTLQSCCGRAKRFNFLVLYVHSAWMLCWYIIAFPLLLTSGLHRRRFSYYIQRVLLLRRSIPESYRLPLLPCATCSSSYSVSPKTSGMDVSKHGGSAYNHSSSSSSSSSSA